MLLRGDAWRMPVIETLEDRIFIIFRSLLLLFLDLFILLLQHLTLSHLLLFLTYVLFIGLHGVQKVSVGELLQDSAI